MTSRTWKRRSNSRRKRRLFRRKIFRIFMICLAASASLGIGAVSGILGEAQF